MEFRFKGKLIGTLHDGVFTKEVDKAKHFCKKYQAWGIDYDSYASLPPETKILIFDRKNKTGYEINQKYSRQFAIVDTLDKKSGRQVFIPIINFLITKLWK